MTDTQTSLSRRYLLYRMFSNMWFLGAVWLYFYRLYITDQQVGILDGMAFAIGLLGEVPSGALADKFGRDRLVRLGQLFVAGGILLQIAGSSFLPFFVGQAIMMVGLSFVSGADDALFFEKLQFERTSTQWRKLVTRGSQASLIGSVVALVAGGYFQAVNPRLPWAATTLAFVISTVVIWPVRDTRPRSARGKPTEEIRDYLQNIKAGFLQFRAPRLRLYVPLIVTLQGLFYAVSFGLLRLILLSRFHFSPLWGSVAVAVSSLLTVGVLAYMHKHADHLSEKHVLVSIALTATAALLLSIANIGLWGYVVILVLYAGEYALQAFMSEVLNNHAAEAQRATVLSVASFLRMLPYVLLAPIIGSLNTHGHLAYFLAGWSVLILAATMLYTLAKRRDTPIAVVAATSEA